VSGSRDTIEKSITFRHLSDYCTTPLARIQQVGQSRARDVFRREIGRSRTRIGANPMLARSDASSKSPKLRRSASTTENGREIPRRAIPGRVISKLSRSKTTMRSCKAPRMRSNYAIGSSCSGSKKNRLAPAMKRRRFRDTATTTISQMPTLLLRACSTCPN